MPGPSCFLFFLTFLLIFWIWQHCQKRTCPLFRCFYKIIQCAHQKTVDWKTNCDMSSFIFLNRLSDKGRNHWEKNKWSPTCPPSSHPLQCISWHFLSQFWNPWQPRPLLATLPSSSYPCIQKRRFSHILNERWGHFNVWCPASCS